MTVAVLWLVASVGYWIAAMRAVQRLGDSDRIEPASNTHAWRPTVTLARPLHGAPHYLRSCLLSLFEAARRSGAGVRLGIQPPEDPARSVVEELLRGREQPVDVRSDPAPPGGNRKVANLIQALDGCDADIVVLSDADISLPVDYVARVTAPLADPSVGLTTCPYRSVPSRSILSRVDALLTNIRFLPSTCLAIRAEGLHFALGATIAVRRDVLELSGGLSELLDEAADDHALACNVERAGYRLAWVPMLLEHHLAEESIGRMMRRQLRWLAVIRSARPFGYLGLLVAHGLVPALWLAVKSGVQTGCWVVVGWWGLEMLLAWRRREILGVTARDLPLLPIVDVAAALLYAGGWVSRARPPD